MKRLLLVLLWLVPVAVLDAQIKYPVATRENVVDDYNGVKVEDPYRWHEDDNSEETKAWLKQENKLTVDYLSKIPFRDKIKQRVEEMWNYPRYGAPFRK